jgi:hypothetical protein
LVARALPVQEQPAVTTAVVLLVETVGMKVPAVEQPIFVRLPRLLTA